MGGNTATWQRRAGSYAGAVLVTALAVGLRLLPGYEADQEPVLILFVVPILLSAYLGGLGPGLLSTAVAALATNYFLIPPRDSLSLPAGFDSAQWIGLIVVGVVVSVLGESLARARRRERERDEGALAERAALLDLTPDAVLVRAAGTDELTFWNAGAYQLYGWSSEQALGRVPHQLLQTQWPDGVDAAQLAVRRDGHWEGELRHRAADGRELVVLSRQTLARDAHGEPRAVLEINTDLTHRIGLEEQLRQAQKLEAVGQLAGGVAHDFNNLLTVIGGFGAVLSEQIGDGQGREEIAEVLRASERATQLTRQLLAFSRRQELELADLDLSVVVRELEPMLRRLIGEDVEVRVHTEPELPAVHADRAQVEQMLMNLAVNARDAMPSGGTLTIEIRPIVLDEGYVRDHVQVEPGHYVCVSVSDTGEGIDPELVPHLFEPFFTTKEVGQGTGLGLATVHGIVTQLGGNVLVYSEPGQGATFKLYLPIGAVPALSAVPPVAAAPEQLEGTETILLCEDEPAVRGLIERLLTKRGYTVLAAALPSQALEIAGVAETTIHAIVSDVIMPEMSGPDLAARLAKIRPGLPVLFVSGYPGDTLRNRASLPLESVVVEKPFDHATLLRTLRRLLEESADEVGAPAQPSPAAG